MKTCSKCGRIYADDELVFCTDDGTPLSAPVTRQSTTPITEPHKEKTIQFPSQNDQPTLVLPDTEPINRRENSTDTNTTTNPLPWWLFGGSVFVIIGLVGLLVVVIGFVIFLTRPVVPSQNQNENQTQQQNQNSSNQNRNEEETEENIETTLRRLNDEIGAAYKRSDVEVLERFLADDYQFKEDNGSVWTKPQVISLLKSGELSYNLVTSSNVSVRVDPNKRKGNVTGYGAITGQLKGNPFVDAWNFNSVYEKRDGKWLLVTVTTWH